MARSASTEEPRRVDELRRKAATLRRLHNTSTRNFSAVVPLLASLISEAQRTAVLASSHDRPLGLWHLERAFYGITSLQLRQLGTWHGLGSRLTAH